MAEVKIFISNEELKEKEWIVKLLKSLSKKEKAKLKGLIDGVAFLKS